MVTTLALIFICFLNLLALFANRKAKSMHERDRAESEKVSKMRLEAHQREFDFHTQTMINMLDMGQFKEDQREQLQAIIARRLEYADIETDFR